jgi:hypothetical protein
VCLRVPVQPACFTSTPGGTHMLPSGSSVTTNNRLVRYGVCMPCAMYTLYTCVLPDLQICPATLETHTHTQQHWRHTHTRSNTGDTHTHAATLETHTHTQQHWRHTHAAHASKSQSLQRQHVYRTVGIRPPHAHTKRQHAQCCCCCSKVSQPVSFLPHNTGFSGQHGHIGHCTRARPQVCPIHSQVGCDPPLMHAASQSQLDAAPGGSASCL